jgi:hypothetical protein
MKIETEYVDDFKRRKTLWKWFWISRDQTGVVVNSKAEDFSFGF